MAEPTNPTAPKAAAAPPSGETHQIADENHPALTTTQGAIVDDFAWRSRRFATIGLASAVDDAFFDLSRRSAEDFLSACGQLRHRKRFP